MHTDVTIAHTTSTTLKPKCTMPKCKWAWRIFIQSHDLWLCRGACRAVALLPLVLFDLPSLEIQLQLHVRLHFRIYQVCNEFEKWIAYELKEADL